MGNYNHRLSYKKRREKAIERGKPAVRRRADNLKEEAARRAKIWFAMLVLLPVTAVSLFTVVELMFRANARTGIWRKGEVLVFALGSLSWAAAYGRGWRPVRSYVFAHEFTHLVIAKLFGGKIYDWRVSAEGGYVETNKSNTLITLGPYLVPFYSLAVLVAFGVLGLFVDMARVIPVGVEGWVLPWRWVWALYWLVGFTWGHHLTFTLQTVHVEQGDLTRNGEFFSMLLIFIVNLALIGSFFVVVLPDIRFTDVVGVWLEMARGGWRFVTELAAVVVR
ncbi:MAG: hypothetical protein K1X78_26575 [Verrucomicrobiaceae bacterium]|nr:hypothetical protein [Verrucomicrobiaceae bacterium]